MDAGIDTWARLLRTEKVLLERVEAALKAADLPPLTWYDVLLELGRDEPEGLRQYEIGTRVLLSKHNLTRLLDRLEDKGLVTRRDCPEDARGKIVFITNTGQALRKRMWPVYAGAIETHFSDKLTTKDIDSLSVILGKLLD